MPRAVAMPRAVFFGMAAENMYASFCYRSREVNTASIGSAIAAAALTRESSLSHVQPKLRSLSVSRSTTVVAPLNDGPQAFGLPSSQSRGGHC